MAEIPFVDDASKTTTRSQTTVQQSPLMRSLSARTCTCSVLCENGIQPFR